MTVAIYPIARRTVRRAHRTLGAAWLAVFAVACTSGQVLGGPCESATDCPTGQACTSGRCEAAACSGRSDCPAGQACAGGLCSPVSCDSAAECLAGEACVSGLCAARGCSGPSDCAAGSSCLDGRCQADACGDSACPAGSACVAGSCVQSDCTGALDCPSGTACVAGSCAAQACDGPADCPVEHACLEGLCGAPPERVAGLDPTRSTPVEEAEPGRIVGLVRDLAGTPIENVRVTVDVEPAATWTDADGSYNLDDVPAGDRVIHFEADGFIPKDRGVTMLDWETVFVNVRMMPRSDETTIDPTTPSTVGDEEGSATIPADAFVGPDGAPLTDPVVVTVTGIDPTGDEIEGGPGDYTAVDEETGESTPLVSYGMIDLTSTDEDGRPVDLAEGEEIEVVLPAPDGVMVGQTIPTWIWDPDIPAWVEDGVAVVEERNGELVLVGSVNQTNIVWNCDDPEVEVCYTGRVTDCAGFPISGVDVELVGSGVTSRTTSRTDADGNYEVRGTARGGAIVRASVRAGDTQYVVDSDVVDVAETCASVPDHVFAEVRYTGGRVEVGSLELELPDGSTTKADAGSAVFYDPADPAGSGFESCAEPDFDTLQILSSGLTNDEDEPVRLDVGNPILIEGVADRLNLLRTLAPSESGELEVRSYSLPFGEALAPGDGRSLDVDIPGAPGTLPRTVIANAISLPDPLVLSAPAADARTVNASDGLAIRWEAAGSDSVILFTITDDTGSVAVTGTLTDDGSFDVSSEFLSPFSGMTARVTVMRVSETYSRMATGPSLAGRGYSSIGFGIEVR